jgi:type IV secretory pathway VirB9-like protein
MIKILLYIVIAFSIIKNATAYVPVTTDARIKTLIYSPTEVFKLKFHHNYQSYIEFPRNEKFKILSLGDRFAWDIQKVDSRLFIKPKQAGVLTNMTIITNKRPYHFEIYSSTKQLEEIDAELVYVARFYYPDMAYDFMQTVKLKKPLKQYDWQAIEKADKDQKDKKGPKSDAKEDDPKEKISTIPILAPVNKHQKNMAMSNGQDQSPTSPPAKSTTNSSMYNYAYSMVGKESAISPTKIYDDGINTYFEFKNNVLPDIFYVNKDGSETPARYSVEKGLVKVANTSWQFSLRNNNNIICVFNENKLQYN